MNTLIINGHPGATSFSSTLVQAYRDKAIQAGKKVEVLHLNKLKFDENLTSGYASVLEPDLIQAQKLIQWAEHLVFVYPTWWWTMPAIMKGFIDRVFLPGFAFRYEKGHALPEKLLKGKTAMLVVTMDSPKWYYKWWMGNAGHIMMKRGVLAFCGIRTTSTITIDRYRELTPARREQWIKKIQHLASVN